MNRNMRKTFHTTRAMIIGLIGLLVLIGAIVYAWTNNRPQAQDESQQSTVQVVDSPGESAG